MPGEWGDSPVTTGPKKSLEKQKKLGAHLVNEYFWQTRWIL